LWISLVLPLISLHSISCFGEIWVRRIWALCVLLPLHLVHQFEFSSEIHGSESKKLITLGFLEPYTALWICGSFVAILGSLQLSCESVP
jgi:hypothetical protein